MDDGTVSGDPGQRVLPRAKKRLGLLTILVVAAVLLAFGGSILPSLLRSRMASNETAAVAALRTYCGAQNIFHRTDYDGDGVMEYAGPTNPEAPDFTCLYSTQVDGIPIELIDKDFARAKLDAPGARPRRGYYFIEIQRDVSGNDYSAEWNYALCAVPAEYGRTGLRTFCVDTQGMVLSDDNKGEPLSQYPEQGPHLWGVGDGMYSDHEGNLWRWDGVDEYGKERYFRKNEKGDRVYWSDYVREYYEKKKEREAVQPADGAE